MRVSCEWTCILTETSPDFILHNKLRRIFHVCQFYTFISLYIYQFIYLSVHKFHPKTVCSCSHVAWIAWRWCDGSGEKFSLGTLSKNTKSFLEILYILSKSSIRTLHYGTFINTAIVLGVHFHLTHVLLWLIARNHPRSGCPFLVFVQQIWVQSLVSLITI
jgi:hypothetical protein